MSDGLDLIPFASGSADSVTDCLKRAMTSIPLNVSRIDLRYDGHPASAVAVVELAERPDLVADRIVEQASDGDPDNARVHGHRQINLDRP